MRNHYLKRYAAALVIGALVATGVDIASAGGVVRGKVVAGDHGRAATKHRAFSTESGVSGASSRRVYQGEDGGGRWSRQKTVTDGEGNAYHRNTKAFRGPEGSSGYKVVEKGHSDDGSAFKNKRREINGAEGGAYASNSNLQRGSDGNVTGSRTVSAESASGKTYQSQIEQQDGQWVREASCTDAAGNSVACR